MPLAVYALLPVVGKVGIRWGVCAILCVVRARGVQQQYIGGWENMLISVRV